LAIDVRESVEGIEVQGSRRLNVKQFFHGLEHTVDEITSLTSAKKPLVFFSQQGCQDDICGLIPAVLKDVFGLPESNLFKLKGGCRAWSEYLDVNPSVSRAVEPLAVRLARRRSVASAAAQGSWPKDPVPPLLRTLAAQAGGG